jgi:hypothetical protein
MLHQRKTKCSEIGIGRNCFGSAKLSGLVGLRPWARASQNSRPGPKPIEAHAWAWLGPGFQGLAWPGLWLEAQACTSLETSEAQEDELSSGIDKGGQAEEIQSKLPSLYTAETEAQR